MTNKEIAKVIAHNALWPSYMELNEWLSTLDGTPEMETVYDWLRAKLRSELRDEE